MSDQALAPGIQRASVAASRKKKAKERKSSAKHIDVSAVIQNQILSWKSVEKHLSGTDRRRAARWRSGLAPFVAGSGIVWTKASVNPWRQGRSYFPEAHLWLVSRWGGQPSSSPGKLSVSSAVHILPVHRSSDIPFRQCNCLSRRHRQGVNGNLS